MYSQKKIQLPYKLTRQTVEYHVLQTVFTCLRSANYSRLRFPKPGPSRQRPGFDPVPQLIKAYSAGIPQYFALSLLLLYLRHICHSLSRHISLSSISLHSSSLWLSSFFPFLVFFFYSLSLSHHLHFLSLSSLSFFVFLFHQ